MAQLSDFSVTFMVEVMNIMTTSFKRTHAHNATLSAPNPAAGHQRPTAPLETPEHSRPSLCQSLVWSLLFSPGLEELWTEIYEMVDEIQEAVLPNHST